MKKFILLALLSGCSGEAFTALDLPDPPPEAAPTQGDEDASDGTSIIETSAEGQVSDAGATAESGNYDSGGDRDSSPDAFDGCTPLTPKSWTCGSSTDIASPSLYCRQSIRAPYYVAIPTPPQCQCAETYNCACLQAVGLVDCNGGICTDNAAEMMVTCY